MSLILMVFCFPGSTVNQGEAGLKSQKCSRQRWSHVWPQVNISTKMRLMVQGLSGLDHRNHVNLTACDQCNTGYCNSYGHLMDNTNCPKAEQGITQGSCHCAWAKYQSIPSTAGAGCWIALEHGAYVTGWREGQAAVDSSAQSSCSWCNRVTKKSMQWGRHAQLKNFGQWFNQIFGLSTEPSSKEFMVFCLKWFALSLPCALQCPYKRCFTHAPFHASSAFLPCIWTWSESGKSMLWMPSLWDD